MSISGIQGLPLEVTVVGCHGLEDKEWISRQDPYVCVEYGNSKFRTKTCTDGGKNPTFQEKFVFTLIEGLRELNVVIWNSHTLTADEFIGGGRVQLHKALTQGFDDASWPLQSKSGRHAGEVRVILHYSNANANPSKTKLAPTAPSYVTPSGAMTQVQPYGSVPQAPLPSPYPATAPYAAPASYTSYPPPSSTTYLPTPYSTAPPAGYPPHSCPPPPSTYPPAPPAGYPPQTYPPAGYPQQPYPPAPQASPYYPQGSSPVVYPPPPSSGVYPPPPSSSVYPPPSSVIYQPPPY